MEILWDSGGIGMSERVRMLTVGEFRAQCGEESQCAEQLTKQRWPEGSGVRVARVPRAAILRRGGCTSASSARSSAR